MNLFGQESLTQSEMNLVQKLFSPDCFRHLHFSQEASAFGTTFSDLLSSMSLRIAEIEVLFETTGFEETKEADECSLAVASIRFGIGRVGSYLGGATSFWRATVLLTVATILCSGIGNR